MLRFKKMSRKIFASILAIVLIFFNITPSITTYAADDDVLYFYNSDGSLAQKFVNSVDFAVYIAEYGLATAGAVVTGSSFETYLSNNAMLNEVVEQFVSSMTDADYGKSGEVVSTDYISYDPNSESVSLSDDFMAQIVALLDDYTSDVGYHIYYTTDFDSISDDYFYNSAERATLRNLIGDSACGFAGLFINPYSLNVSYYDFTDIFYTDALVNGAFMLSSTYNDYIMVRAYNVDGGATVYQNCITSYTLIADSITDIYYSFDTFSSDFVGNYTSPGSYYMHTNFDGTLSTGGAFLYSIEPMPIRVFDSCDALLDYSLDSRDVYYTYNYYTYAPTDTTSPLSDIVSLVDSLSDLLSSLISATSDITCASEDVLLELLTDLLSSAFDSVVDSATSSSDDTAYSSPVTTSWLNSVLDYFSAILSQLKKLFTVSSESNLLLGEVVELLTPTEESEEVETETEIETETESEDEESSGWLDIITDYLNEILEQLKKIKNWTIADTVTDVADAVADWASFISDFFSDVTSGVATIASGFSGLADTLSGKFPFSIPWDLAFLIALLAAEPSPPEFELPIYLPNYGIDYTFTLDFADFAILSQISRCLLTITFIIGLLKFTEKIINVKEEG